MKRIARKEISELPIRDLLARWPDMTRAFMKLHMSCVCCPFSKFETAQDAARNYGREVDAFLRQLERCLPQGEKAERKTATTRCRRRGGVCRLF
ncbi:MAG: hypothetical protein ACP5QA_00800 [Phycisphaerae bacterium]